ncbi:MAG: hypothetical protein KF863_00480 [Rubrivivax sp.]|nr:hypothetical protein [Rubrivivax sp.]
MPTTAVAAVAAAAVSATFTPAATVAAVAAAPARLPTAPAAVPSALAGAGVWGVPLRDSFAAPGATAAVAAAGDAVSAIGSAALTRAGDGPCAIAVAPPGRLAVRASWRTPSRAISSGVRGSRPSSSEASASSSRPSVSPPSQGSSSPPLASTSARRVRRSASGALMRGDSSAAVSVAAKRLAATSRGSRGAGTGSGAAAGASFARPSASPHSAITPGGRFSAARPRCGSAASAGCWKAASTTSRRGLPAGPCSTATTSASGTPWRRSRSASGVASAGASGMSRGSTRLWPSSCAPRPVT